MHQLMKRVLGAVFVGMIVVLPADITHACSPLPERWTVRLTSVSLHQAALPTGVMVTAGAAGLTVANTTAEVVVLTRTLPDGEEALFTVAPSEVLDISYADSYALFADVPAPDVFVWDPPDLPSYSTLSLEHTDQHYDIPVTLSYSVQHFPMDASGCEAMNQSIAVIGIAAVVAGILLVLGVLTVLGLGIFGLIGLFSRNRSA